MWHGTKNKYEGAKQVLNDNCDFIINNLDPDDVSDELIQDHLMGENAAQKVTQPMDLGRQEKNRIIADQLSISGTRFNRKVL